MRLSYGGDQMNSHSSSLLRHFTSLLALTSIASAGLPQLNLDDAGKFKLDERVDMSANVLRRA